MSPEEPLTPPASTSSQPSSSRGGGWLEMGFFALLFGLLAVGKFRGDPMTTLMLCGSIGVVLFGLALVYVLVRLFLAINRHAVQPSENIIDEAPVTWLIPGWLGWIYVDGDTQVGVVGKKLYKTSGLFWQVPAYPKRRKVVSRRRFPIQARVQSPAADRSLLTIVAQGYARVRWSQVHRLITEVEEPFEYLKTAFANQLTHLIQRSDREYLKRPEARKDLEQLCSAHIPYFHIRVASMVPEGRHIERADIIARSQEEIEAGLIEQYPQALIEEHLIKVLTGQTSDSLRQKALHTEQVPELPPRPELQGLPGQARAQKLLLAARRLGFQLLKKEPSFYYLKYRAFLVRVNIPDDQADMVVQLFDLRDRRRQSKPFRWHKTPEALLQAIKAKIDRAQG